MRIWRGLAAAGFLTLAAVAEAAAPQASVESAHLDGGTRWIFAKPEALDERLKSVGYPATGASFFLISGGGTLVGGDLRTQLAGATGSLSARNGNRASAWDLNLASLSLEQRYDYGSLLMTAGASTEYAVLSGRLEDSPRASFVQVPLYGGGVTLGFRWPARTKMGFFVRSSYLWLQGSGEWKGELGSMLGGQVFDLSGPSLTAQVEISL